MRPQPTYDRANSEAAAIIIAIDLDAARTYLIDLEKLIIEARTSEDPRVLRLALDVLRQQHKTIAQMEATIQ